MSLSVSPAGLEPESLADDLGAYIIAGRVASHSPVDVPNETAVRTPRQGIEDGLAAETLGFRRVYLSERWNLKEAMWFLAPSVPGPAA